MKKLIVTFGLAALLFSGAAFAQNQEAEIRAAFADCESQYHRHLLRTATAWIQCFHARFAAINAAHNRAITDWDRLLMAKGLELADKVDRRVLTEAEAKLHYNEYAMAVKQQAIAQAQNDQAIRQQRQQAIVQTEALERQMQAARQQAATQQLLGAAAAVNNYWVPQFPQPAQPRSLNCYVNRSPSLSGPTLNCN
jgi:hypothetical protein